LAEEEHPDVKCKACPEELAWHPQMGVYVDTEGMPMCYPPGQPLGNLAHDPDLPKEETK
jgi:hypothetical protein